MGAVAPYKFVLFLLLEFVPLGLRNNSILLSDKLHKISANPAINAIKICPKEVA